MTMSTPWSDCKVAFGIDDCAKFERWTERTNWGVGLWPAGWSMIEIDTSGARMVVVFRIEGFPTEADGKAVLRLLAKHGGYRERRLKKAA